MSDLIQCNKHRGGKVPCSFVCASALLEETTVECSRYKSLAETLAKDVEMALGAFENNNAIDWGIFEEHLALARKEGVLK